MVKRGFNRAERVADLIRQTIAETLLREMRDERFRLITITGVELSRDLAYAKVFVSVLSDDKDEIKKTIDDLNKIRKLIRHHVAQKVELRIVPELKFTFDESVARGYKINCLLNEAEKKASKNNDN